MKRQSSSFFRIGIVLALASVAGIGLFVVGAIRNQSFDFWYLPYNLVLAFIPLLLAVALKHLLATRAWNTWLPLLVSLMWILFLPNSFYIVTDFIHLTETPRVDIVQDVVMLMQFSFVGLAFGFISLYMVHRDFMQRISAHFAAAFAGLLLLLCSFAIYLGRDLRWNSWDIVTQPLGLFADIFSRILNPFAYPQAFIMTLSFFVMLGSMYGVIWQVGRVLLAKNESKK